MNGGRKETTIEQVNEEGGVAREHTWRAALAQSSASPRPHLPPPPPTTLPVYSPSATMQPPGAAVASPRRRPAHPNKHREPGGSKEFLPPGEGCSASRVLSKRLGGFARPDQWDDLTGAVL